MRILIFYSSSSDGPSGEREVVFTDAEALRSSGNEVFIVKYDQSIKSNVLRVFLMPFFVIWSPSAYFFVKQKIKIHKPNIIHFHGIFPYLSISAIMAAISSKVPVVQTLHNVRYICLEGGFHRSNKFCNICINGSYFKGVIYGCYRNRILSLFLYISGLISRIFFSINKKNITFIAVSSYIQKTYKLANILNSSVKLRYSNIPKFNKKLVPLENRTGIIYVSRISISKGSNVIKYLINNSNLLIEIIGSGPELLKLVDIAKERKPKVIFYGQLTRNKVIDKLSKAKCCIVPSQCGEAFSLVAAEALSVGTPVICSDIGGVSELVKKSRGGLITPPEDFNGFLSKINSLFKNEKLWTEKSKAGISYFNRELNNKKSNDKLMNIYKNISRKNKSDY